MNSENEGVNKNTSFPAEGVVTVVVVSWNAGEQLFACVESIKNNGNGLVRNIVVVDNNSFDGCEKRVEGLDYVTLIRAGDNLGFGRACNIGARTAKTEYLLFLNPDAAIYANTLPEVLSYMQNPKNAQVGICGVQLLDEAGRIARSCSRFPSVTGFGAHALALNRLFPRLGHRMAEWDHAGTKRVDQVIGAFFWVRRSLFEKLEGFDERFFVYFEEVDFSYRASRLGLSSIYLGGVQAFHAGGGTSNQVKARRLFYSLRSRLLYVSKHFSIFGIVATLLITLFVEPLSRSAFALARGSLSSFSETWVAYRLLWSWLPEWMFRGDLR